VNSAAALRAKVSGIAEEPNAHERAFSCSLPSEDQECSIDECLNLLRKCPADLHSTEYSKDDDLHINFVYAAATVRAENYSIESRDWLTIQRMAGNIVPAMATTTAMVAGFVALEMYKVHSIHPHKISDYRFGSINMAINLFSLSCPLPPSVTVCPTIGLRFTAWDSWVLRGDLTLNELFQEVVNTFHVRVSCVYFGRKLLYSKRAFRGQSGRLPVKITETLVNDLHEKPLGDGQFIVRLTVDASDEAGNEVPLPMASLHVR
jgi:ubiquitin-activating enzyme E1